MRNEEIYKKAINFARRRGQSEIAEDYAGWLITKLLDGKRQTSTMQQTFYEYLRKEYGNTRDGCHTDALLRANRQSKREISGPDEYTDEEYLDFCAASSSYVEANDPRDSSDEKQHIALTRKPREIILFEGVNKMKKLIQEYKTELEIEWITF